MTLLCDISPTLGLIHSQTMIGGAKQRDFDDFITTLFDINFGPAWKDPEISLRDTSS